MKSGGYSVFHQRVDVNQGKAAAIDQEIQRFGFFAD